MGFDNECILNIQSLPGEYFCPVCRTLIYPNEALQAQCTHLYCKPCLAYIVATTQACPYDGYLVTEIDSKPLVESNKSLAETIGKVTVHCLYHKSGCQWQGTLSDCVTHCASCAFGNSPVVCNRCGTQIIHRQVQEHAQICPGLQSQVQQTEGAQPQSSGVTTTQAASQDPLAVASAAPAAVVTAAPAATATATTVATTTGIAGATTAGTTAPVPGPAAAPAPAGQGQAVPQAPTAEQWYQQQLQYQQYYQQQYPGYNPYMQQYQQYGQYQQSYQQYTQPQMQVAPQHAAQASMQPSPYVQSQPQVQQQQPQPQSMVQPQPQTQSHLQPHLQAQAAPPPPQQHLPLQPVSQVPQMQAPQTQVLPQPPHPQAQPTAHPPAHTQVGSQSFGLPVTQAPHPQVVPHAQPQQQHLQPPQHQQAVAHQQHPQLQPPYMQPLPQQQQHGQPQMQPSSQIQHQHPQMQHQAYPQPQAYPHPQSVAQAQLHNPSAHAVTGHQSYPQPQPVQMPQGAPLQHPVHMSHQQGVSPQPAQMRPPQGQFSVQGQQPAMLPLQGTHPNVQHTPQQPHHVQQLPVHASIPSQAPQHGFPPQQSVPLQTGQSYQQGMSSSQQQMHPQQPFQPHGPPYTQQHLHVHGFAGQQAQTAAVRPTGHGVPPQQLQHPPSGPVKDLQRSAMNQQPPMLMPSVNMGVASQSQGAGQPTGQGLLAHPESHASQSGKPEKTTYATGSTEISELHKIQGAGVQPVISESLGDQKMPRDSEESEFGNARKDAAQPSHTDAVGVQSDNTGALNKAKSKDEIADAHCKEDGSHDLDVSGDKGPKASDVSGSLERGSGQHLPQQNVGGLGPHVLQGTGQQQPPGPDRMHPLHMPHAGAMPYHMQGQRPEMLPNQMRPPSHILPENTRPPAQQLYSSYHSEFAPRLPGQFYGQNQNQMAMPQPAGIRPHGEGMIRPPMGGPSPGLHDVSRPPFALEHVGRPRPPGSSTLELEANTSGLLDARQVEPPFIQSGMPKSNGVGGPLIGGRALHEEGFKSAGEHIRPFASYHSRHNVNHRDVEEDLKQFSRPLHLDGEGFQRGPRPFGRAFGGSDGFPDSFPGRPSFSHQPRGPFPAGKEQYPPEFGERHRPSGFHEDFAIKANSAAGRPDFLSSGTEFGHRRIDGMPPFGSPGPFPGGLRKEQLGSGNLPGNMRHNFDGPEFPHARFHSGDSFGPRNLPGGGWRGEPVGPGQIRGIEPSGYRYPGQMHPDDPDFVIDYSRHSFPKESGHFGLGGYPRKREIGWCRICRFNCGGTEDLDLHVQTRDHQQRAMDLVLKMKQDVAKRQKLGSEGSKSFDEKKVSGKSSFGARGNRH